MNEKELIDGIIDILTDLSIIYGDPKLWKKRMKDYLIELLKINDMDEKKVYDSVLEKIDKTGIFLDNQAALLFKISVIALKHEQKPESPYQNN